MSVCVCREYIRIFIGRSRCGVSGTLDWKEKLLLLLNRYSVGAAIIGNCASAVPQVCMQHTPWWSCLHLNLHFSCASGNKLPSAVGNYARRYFCSNGRLPAHHLAAAPDAGPSHLACLHSHFTTSTRGCIPDALQERADDRSLAAAAGIARRPARAQIALQTAKASRFSHYSTLRGENFGCPEVNMRFFVSGRVINFSGYSFIMFW